MMDFLVLEAEVGGASVTLSGQLTETSHDRVLWGEVPRLRSVRFRCASYNAPRFGCRFRLAVVRSICAPENVHLGKDVWEVVSTADSFPSLETEVHLVRMGAPMPYEGRGAIPGSWFHLS
jgi:hypothetical protein